MKKINERYLYLMINFKTLYVLPKLPHQPSKKIETIFFMLYNSPVN